VSWKLTVELKGKCRADCTLKSGMCRLEIGAYRALEVLLMGPQTVRKVTLEVTGSWLVRVHIDPAV
jgi:hypothetical protein